MFGFGDGKKFQNELARVLGVEGNLVGTCLLEVGISWSHLKHLKRAGVTPEAVLHTLAPSMLQGVHLLEQRFGQQPELRKLEVALLPFGPQPEPDVPLVGRLRGVEFVHGVSPERERPRNLVNSIPGKLEGAYALVLCHDLGNSYTDPGILAQATSIPEVHCQGIFERLEMAGFLESLRERDGTLIYRLSHKGRPIASELRNLHQQGEL